MEVRAVGTSLEKQQSFPAGLLHAHLANHILNADSICFSCHSEEKTWNLWL
jgi:hypothetical protein